MDSDILTKYNYIQYALGKYKNPNCRSLKEFNEDMNRIKYVKRLLRKYDRTGDLKERLIVNHIIILQNVFGVIPCCRILFYKIEKEYHIYLKSFLDYLNYSPFFIPEVNINNIPTDHKIINTLKNLK